jgi:hypothetical protein
MGATLVPSAELRDGLYGLVCHWYDFQGFYDVNSVRYQMFKGGKYEEDSLPPNQNSLDQHINRANYQCYIWRHANQPVQNLPNFCDHGWKIDDQGDVLVNWMTLPPAPDSVLEFVHCKCTKGCENNRCSCVKATLRCSDLCKCTNCKNELRENDDSNDADTYDYSECSTDDSDNEDESTPRDINRDVPRTLNGGCSCVHVLPNRFLLKLIQK